MGWARALEDKQVIIVRRKDSPEPKSDYKNDTYHGGKYLAHKYDILGMQAGF